MSETEQPIAGAGSTRSRIVVVGLGVGAMLVGLVIIPLFPFVVIAVVIWWLADDLRRGAPVRTGWLGWLALGVFAVLTVGTGFVVTLFDAHFDCGGTLGGYGEAADARLDTECRDARMWRTVVAGVVTLLICAGGVVALRRFGSSRSPLVVSAAVIGGMLAATVAVLAAVTVS